MVRELSKHQGVFLFDCCVFIARFASSSCYSSAKTRIQPVKSYQDSILCQFGPRNLSSVQQLISQPILIHFWWELYQKGSVLSLSTKQKSNTSSSMETELVRVNDTMSLVLWVCSFLQAQDPEVINNVIFQDDQSYW